MIKQIILLSHWYYFTTLFYTKRPNRPNKMARFNFFQERKQIFNHKTNNDTSKLNTPSVQNPTLSTYSRVTTNPNDYTMDNIPVSTEI